MSIVNKIKIMGEVLPIKNILKETPEKRAVVYFSLQVINPNNSISIQRCLATGEMAEKIEKEISAGEVAEIEGYLRNEKIGRQILIKVIEFNKLAIRPADIEYEQSNQVQLRGKVMDLKTQLI